ncbi:serine hydrolase domain-containing protein [Phytohabitans sp. LJ34]|uniref:serine hydrolase domain-containing protein n=1 Tax=Phytohabitans sp. LJ34 TaxID=3452217 RepID=UPI003F8AB0BE
MNGRVAMGGWVDSQYSAVCDAFADQMNTGRAAGAAVAVVQDGRLVLDLHAGWQDPTRSVPWSARTLTPLFCLGKAVTALAVLMLASRRLVDLDAPVARYWPAFGAAGKDQVSVRQLLSHSAGLPAFPIPRPARLIPYWQILVNDLANAAPLWPPGTAVAEHALTYGHLVGELVRQVDGRTLGVFLRDEIARPAQLDLALGLNPKQQTRAAQVRHADEQWLPRTLGLPYTPRQRALDCPVGAFDPDVINSAYCRGAPLPAVNIYGTARSVAMLFSTVLSASRHQNASLLDPVLATDLGRVHIEGYDLVLNRSVRRGLGVIIEDDGSWGVGALGGNLLAVDPAAGRIVVYLSSELGDEHAAAAILKAARGCG